MEAIKLLVFGGFVLIKSLGIAAYFAVLLLAYYLLILGAQLAKDAYTAGYLFGGGA